MARNINMQEYDYPLPEERIAKYPLPSRSDSKLLHYKDGIITERSFPDIVELIPEESLIVFNNTKVIRARIIMQKSTGARVEIFCLEPHSPADYERAFAARSECEWSCIVGNLKRWKSGCVTILFEVDGVQELLSAEIVKRGEREHIIKFSWGCNRSFGEILEILGRIPIPPYLCRESEPIDESRYQTIYSKMEGSVAAPTAGLHFTDDVFSSLQSRGVELGEVTLHVGAGTFLPVKTENAAEHPMHTEHFDITLEMVDRLIAHHGNITAVGTTSVRTLESLVALGYRAAKSGDVDAHRTVGQWELYDIPTTFTGYDALTSLRVYMATNNMERLKTSTQIMITPLGYSFKIVRRIVTNFHQPKSTLLLLVSAYVGEAWHEIYRYALTHDFRFLSYGDSSLLDCAESIRQ